MKNAGNFCKFLILYDEFVRAMFAVLKCITCMVSELMTFGSVCRSDRKDESLSSINKCNGYYIGKRLNSR